MLRIFGSLLQMYIDLTGPTVTAIPVKYDPHKKIVPLLAALYHTWVLIKRYFVDFQISWYLPSSFTLENGEGGKGEDIRSSELMDLLVCHTKDPPPWNKFSQFFTSIVQHIFHINSFICFHIY